MVETELELKMSESNESSEPTVPKVSVINLRHGSSFYKITTDEEPDMIVGIINVDKFTYMRINEMIFSMQRLLREMSYAEEEGEDVVVYKQMYEKRTNSYSNSVLFRFPTACMLHFMEALSIAVNHYVDLDFRYDDNANYGESDTFTRAGLILQTAKQKRTRSPM